MYLDAAKKQEIFEKYGKSNTDTGSAEAQIALFSYRISHLTEHLKLNRKDYSTERALTTLVGKRRALLNYLKDHIFRFFLQWIMQIFIGHLFEHFMQIAC